MADAHPFTKAQQLARGERRYRRKVASPKQWQAISEAKRGPCRICSDRNPALLELHHLVSRQDHGDDVADNLVPLCRPCHDSITRRVPSFGRLLLSRLSDAEYAYMVTTGGEDYRSAPTESAMSADRVAASGSSPTGAVTLSPTSADALRMLIAARDVGHDPHGVVANTMDGPYLNGGQVFIAISTARALERRGLIRIEEGTDAYVR